MKVTFLGTGTSHGIPVINCNCNVCLSKNPKNKRLRTSVLIEIEKTNILIDTSPDFRQQFLRKRINRIDAVLFTHVHADHTFGLDDLRRFCWIQKERIPIYGKQDSMEYMKNIFTYAFGVGELRYGVPNLKANNVSGEFQIGEIKILPIQLWHGKDIIYGYRINNFAYCTDVGKIPDHSYVDLENLDVLVLDALRQKPHPTHFSLNKAMKEAKKINAKKTYFTHMNHTIDHEEHGKSLPESMNFAYDGLEIKV
jgi:phosphoribosyl 1,2-cyclic phosphate phosphodiesterase